MKRLTGKVAIAARGSRGIGRAIVKRFVDEIANVAILDVRKDEVERLGKDLSGQNYNVVYSNVDNINEQEVAQAVHAVLSS